MTWERSLQLLGLTLLIGANAGFVIVVGVLQDVGGALTTEPGSGSMPDERVKAAIMGGLFAMS